MDRRTERELQKLGRQIPREIREKLGGERRIDEADLLMREITQRNLKKVEDPLKKKEIEGYLKNAPPEGSWERDLRAETQAEKFVEAKVKKLIESGKIPPPRTDSEMKRWAEKMKE